MAGTREHARQRSSALALPFSWTLEDPPQVPRRFEQDGHHPGLQFGSAHTGGLDPDTYQANLGTLGRDGLGRPDTIVGLATGDGPQLSVRLGFGDDGAANDDADARRAYLADGVAMVSHAPVSDLLTDPEVSVAGPVETVTFDLEGGVANLDQMVRSGDLAAACA